jgi:hypothetical protein
MYVNLYHKYDKAKDLPHHQSLYAVTQKVWWSYLDGHCKANDSAERYYTVNEGYVNIFKLKRRRRKELFNGLCIIK